MEFDYIAREWDRGTLYVPVLPISLNGFPVGNALVDTGADVTVLPMVLHEVFDIDLDRDHSIEVTGANGVTFCAIPSFDKIEFCVEQAGKRITWFGTVFFSSQEQTILLGQYECLSELKITLDGKRRKIRIE